MRFFVSPERRLFLNGSGCQYQLSNTSQKMIESRSWWCFSFGMKWFLSRCWMGLGFFSLFWSRCGEIPRRLFRKWRHHLLLGPSYCFTACGFPLIDYRKRHLWPLPTTVWIHWQSDVCSIFSKLWRDLSSQSPFTDVSVAMALYMLFDKSICHFEAYETSSVFSSSSSQQETFVAVNDRSGDEERKDSAAYFQWAN